MQIEKTCQTCGKIFFVPHWRLSAKYCSPDCRQVALHAPANVVCPACGKLFHRKPSYIKRFKGNEGFYCSKECSKMGDRIRMTGSRNHQYGLRGKLNASFKEEELPRKNHNNTDIKVFAPGHPYRDKNNRVLKHRLVVEDNFGLFEKKWFIVIGGKHYLRKEAVVHHIDGNHDNNDINNLMVLTRGEHTAIHNQERRIIRNTATGRIMKIIPAKSC